MSSNTITKFTVDEIGNSLRSLRAGRPVLLLDLSSSKKTVSRRLPR